ncbi:MAG: iron-sulfur cluster assembly scaffold protein [Pseudomonadota bacterium]
MFGDLYHNRVLELAGSIPRTERLEAPQGSAEKVSRVCGSVMTVDVVLDDERRIADIGLDPRACALGQASASVLARNAIGKSLDEIKAVRDALRAMLKEGGEPPDGDFWELRHLEGVKDYPQRHASTLLAFEACIAAMEDALN